MPACARDAADAPGRHAPAARLDTLCCGERNSSSCWRPPGGEYRGPLQQPVCMHVSVSSLTKMDSQMRPYLPTPSVHYVLSFLFSTFLLLLLLLLLLLAAWCCLVLFAVADWRRAVCWPFTCRKDSWRRPTSRTASAAANSTARQCALTLTPFARPAAVTAEYSTRSGLYTTTG